MQFWQSAWKLSILLPPFLPKSWQWQNGVAEERGALTFPPHIYCPFPHQELHSLPLSLLKHANTFHDVLYLENMLIYMQRLYKIKQKNPSQEAILSIKGLSRLTKFCCSLLSAPAVALKSPSCFCFIVEFNTKTAFLLCPCCLVLSVLC